MNNVAFTITPSGILLFLNGKQSQVPQDHPNYSKIKDLLVTKQFSKITEDLLDARSAVKKWILSNRRFSLTNDHLALDGRTFNDAVTDKVLRMIETGHNPDALYNFLIKVRQNPSNIAQDELLLFCVANNFMIHEDGDILAYKSVRADFTDIHSGKYSNKVGQVVQMERNAVDDNRERTCSHGLHFASHEYASTWTSYGHLMLLKLNPKDVVSIPSDYNNQKGRTCRYVVIAELSESKPLPHKEVYNNKDLRGWDEVEQGEIFDDYEDEDCPCGCQDNCCDDEDEDFLDEWDMAWNEDEIDEAQEKMEHKAEVCRKWMKQYDNLRPWESDHTLRAKIRTIIEEMVNLEDEFDDDKVVTPDDVRDFTF